MPDVPNVPGVPPLTSFGDDIIALVADDLGALGLFSPTPLWGVFENGDVALPYNSIISFAYKNDNPISDYPVEDGGFQSYDKVQLPGDIRVKMTSGPSAADRAALLNAIDVARVSLDLFDLVTPEIVYPSYNITHVDYDRKADSGVGMIVLDVWFTEVRQTATATYTKTQTPVAQGNQNSGAVQPQTPPTDFETRFGGSVQ